MIASAVRKGGKRTRGKPSLWVKPSLPAQDLPESAFIPSSSSVSGSAPEIEISQGKGTPDFKYNSDPDQSMGRCERGCHQGDGVGWISWLPKTTNWRPCGAWRATGPRFHEPFYGNERMAEIGNSWENQVLDGKIIWSEKNTSDLLASALDLLEQLDRDLRDWTDLSK